MSRTVRIANFNWAVPSLGRQMDAAFDQMYASFSEGVPLSIDDGFKAASFQYFDSYVNNADAQAAHDHYFNCFGPIWGTLMPSGRLEAAETVWKLAFEPVQQWETAHPGELVDKGVLCYFWGATALLRGDLDQGYLLIHQAVEEDGRTSGHQIPPTPSYALVSLDYDKPDQWFRPWVIEQGRFLEGFVCDYANTHHRPLTMGDVRRKFLNKPPNYDAVFLLTFTLARLHGLSGLPDRAKRNDFAGQIQLNLLFDVLLVIDVAIRAVNPGEWHFSKQALFLLERAGHKLDHKDFDYVHLQFKPPNFEAALQSALNGTLKSKRGTLDPLQCDVHLAYELRNRGAHEIETVPAIWKEFDRVQRAVFHCLFAVVDFLY